MRKPVRLCQILLAMAVALGLSVTPAAASVIEIQFTGLNLKYDGSKIADSTDPAGGSGNPAQADALATMVFLKDGVSVGALTSSIWGDVNVLGVSNIPAVGGTVTSAGNLDTFGFDLLTSASDPSAGLLLNINQVNLYYMGSGIYMTFGGKATSVRSALLPFSGLEIDTAQPITFVTSTSHLSNLTYDGTGTYLTGFNWSGTGSIKATLVPEPCTLALAGLGLAGLVGNRLRKARQVGAP